MLVLALAHVPHRELSMDPRTAGFLNSPRSGLRVGRDALAEYRPPTLGHTFADDLHPGLFAGQSASALSHSVTQLQVFRCVLGLGMGGEMDRRGPLTPTNWGAREHRGQSARHDAIRITAMAKPSLPW